MRNFIITFFFLFSFQLQAQNLVCLGSIGQQEGEIRITIWEDAERGLLVYSEEMNEEGDWAEASASLVAEEQPPFILYIQSSESAGFLGDFVLQFDPQQMTAAMELAFSPLGNENLFVENMNCIIEASSN